VGTHKQKNLKQHGFSWFLPGTFSIVIKDIRILSRTMAESFFLLVFTHPLKKEAKFQRRNLVPNLIFI
jgi:hypothetical protein